MVTDTILFTMQLNINYTIAYTCIYSVICIHVHHMCVCVSVRMHVWVRL